jgi:hypothetical protein
VRSIVGLRGGAGPAWLLHTLSAEFGVDRKVAGVRRAAPRRQWLPAWRIARPQQHPPLQASEQPPQQPEQQPPQQQQQPAQGAAATGWQVVSGCHSYLTSRRHPCHADCCRGPAKYVRDVADMQTNGANSILS